MAAIKHFIRTDEFLLKWERLAFRYGEFRVEFRTSAGVLTPAPLDFKVREERLTKRLMPDGTKLPRVPAQRSFLAVIVPVWEGGAEADMLFRDFYVRVHEAIEKAGVPVEAVLPHFLATGIFLEDAECEDSPMWGLLEADPKTLVRHDQPTIQFRTATFSEPEFQHLMFTLAREP